MSRLLWDQTGEKLYETGVDRGVLYKRDSKGQYPLGVPWNGLTAVNESPEGAEANPLYADNKKYLDLISAEQFKYGIEAYTYPDEWADCDGSKEIAPGVFATQQSRSHFGMSYRSLIGNDVENTDYGYKLHLVYDSTASPSEKNNTSVNDSPEATTFSWECSTTPVECPDCKPTAHIIIDSTKADKDTLKRLEDILYGTDKTEARLPLPKEVYEIFHKTEAGTGTESETNSEQDG